jgi:hypothetical protein
MWEDAGDDAAGVESRSIKDDDCATEKLLYKKSWPLCSNYISHCSFRGTASYVVV